ncbi:MAG: hypothetical protein ACK47Q_16530 [Dolichospermum sp.]
MLLRCNKLQEKKVFVLIRVYSVAIKVVCEGREQGTGNREQGTVLTVWISSIFQIRERKMHLF